MFCVQTFTYLNQVSMSATNDKQVSILLEVCFDDCQFTHSWGSFSNYFDAFINYVVCCSRTRSVSQSFYYQRVSEMMTPVQC